MLFTVGRGVSGFWLASPPWVLARGQASSSFRMPRRLLPSTCFLFSFLVYHCSENYKDVDLIAEAYARTWGDVHVWIHINKSDNSKKVEKFFISGFAFLACAQVRFPLAELRAFPAQPRVFSAGSRVVLAEPRASSARLCVLIGRRGESA